MTTPLHIDAQITVEHADGTLIVKSLSADSIHLQFTTASVFRAFLNDFVKGKAQLDSMQQLQQVLNQIKLSLKISIEGKQVLRLAPNEAADIAYFRLLPQWLLTRLGL